MFNLIDSSKHDTAFQDKSDNYTQRKLNTH